ncbi:class E sortase [Streptomyces sp. TRM43335]|uniref:Class E sortase n=2 Tax=Streptomyces taklimakanensis TaxID=2569853 RepID=A0A6G2BDJ2_9ACTN|nr:class E sortase [Streptomyces taklimakanensis]
MALRRVRRTRDEPEEPYEPHEPEERNPSPPIGGRAARRRAQRAARESPAVIASRVAGEVFITLGVVMLLFVSYQLWWTNVLADRHVGNETKKLEQQWGDEEERDRDRDPGVFSPGEGFAIMHIPRLDVKVPVAEGVDEDGVLDRGMVGHYGEEPLKTAMPWDEKGNFAVAGHRNTHGEPFRYINKLDPGDPIVVETRDTYYVYEVTSRLDSTPPSNVDVIGPVPPGSGFTEPGRYITLTTCTPEFTSEYRLIVWGELAEEHPRNEGKPDALVR